MRRALVGFGWWLMFLLAALVGLYSFLYLTQPDFASSPLKRKLLATAAPTYAHILFGGIAIIAGPWQFRERLRTRRPQWHRKLGWIYSLAVAVAGISGFRLALSSDGGVVTHLGFGLLALGWLVSLAMALLEVKQRDYDSHRLWMIRNYSLTLAAVTLRMYLSIANALGLDFLTAYQWISWLAWVPNMAAAEWYIQRNKAPRLEAARAVELDR